MRFNACLLFLFTAHFVQAQLTAIKAGKLVDPVSGKTFTDQIILIEGEKIKEVGSDVKIPAGATIVDLSSSTILPGLFDAHTHLCATLSIHADRLGIDYFDMILLNPPGYRAIQGSVHAKEMLEAGFTTVRDAGNSGKYTDVDVKRAIDEGLIKGPTIVAAGRIIAPFGGQFRTKADEQFLKNDEYFFADTHDELLKAIRENIYYGSGVIKIAADGQKYTYSYEDLKFIVDQASNANTKVMVHCQTPAAEYNAAKAGVASIEHGWTLADSTAQLMKKNNVVLVSTDFTEKVLLGFGWDAEGAKRIHAKRVERLKRAYDNGVTIAFGTDVMIDIKGETRGTLAIGYIESFAEAGIPAVDILRIMTVNAAKLLGVEKKRGTIQPGMYADIIAVPSNPVDDIQSLKKVNFVMKNGSIILQKNN